MAVVEQVFSVPQRRAGLLGCEPADAGCRRGFFEAFGARVVAPERQSEEKEREA